MIAYWDDVESGRAEAGHIAGLWTDLGSAAGTKTVGVCRIQVDPGRWSTPFHRESGLTFLAYGTTRPDDVCYYPRSNKYLLPRARPDRPARGPGLRRRRTALSCG